MIHPDTKLEFIDDQKGYGIFATAFIPKGTLVYVKDLLEIEITPDEFIHQPKAYREIIEKYTYIDEKGNRILSWDLGKYVNHCCNANTISTGYGFEIAIRDILPEEEITDEYGLFNLQYEMEVFCGKNCCREKIKKTDLDNYADLWDKQIKSALKNYQKVPQPLSSYLGETTKADLAAYFCDPRKYQSVRRLKFNSNPTISPVISWPSSNAF